IPVAVLLFDRYREKGGERDNIRDIVFVDASREFISGKTRNSMSNEHFNRILTTVHARQNLDGYAALATFEEIAKNDFNLNIPRYVNVFAQEEEIDLNALERDIEQLESELSETRASGFVLLPTCRKANRQRTSLR